MILEGNARLEGTLYSQNEDSLITGLGGQLHGQLGTNSRCVGVNIEHQWNVPCLALAVHLLQFDFIDIEDLEGSLIIITGNVKVKGDLKLTIFVIEGARILKCNSAAPSMHCSAKLIVQSKSTWVMISVAGVENELGSLSLRRGILLAVRLDYFWAY